MIQMELTIFVFFLFSVATGVTCFKWSGFILKAKFKCFFAFCLCFSIFNFGEQNYIQLILSSQALLSTISVVLFYKINNLFFSKKISFYSSLLFSVLPLHVYACGQISSASLQIFLSTLFFYIGGILWI